MKTDELFYELFKLDPRSLFRLVQLDLEGEYMFESLTVKTTEKRFDGFCKRIDAQGPNIFLEIQGYNDPRIYWRLFREIFTYYELTDETLAETAIPFIAIVLFLDAKYDPGNCPVTCIPPNQLIHTNLLDCLRAVWDNAGVLTVLKPLTLSQKEEVYHYIQYWKTDIYNLSLPQHKMQTVLGLLEYIILQRFPQINSKEVTAMLQLTPLEKTVAGQEVYQMGIKEGREKGKKEGLRKGELIGEIRLAQRLLKRPLFSVEELAEKSLRELKELFHHLEAELNWEQ